jgi:hypothetical protein
MMAIGIQFDTLDYAKKLETAGVPLGQAEVQAKALGDALSRSIAFPGDLVALENNLSTKMTTSETRLETKIETVKTELKLELGGKIETLKWMAGVLVALNVGILIRMLMVH